MSTYPSTPQTSDESLGRRTNWKSILDFTFTFLISFLSFLFIFIMVINIQAFMKNEKTPYMQNYRMIEKFNHANPEVPIQEEDLPQLHRIAQFYGCEVTISIDDQGRVAPGNAMIQEKDVVVSPYMPKNQIASMILHECSHAKQSSVMNAYDIQDLDIIYPPTQVVVPDLPVAGYPEDAPEIPRHNGTRMMTVPGYEQNADCIAREMGATVAYYTKNCERDRGEAARDILNGINPIQKLRDSYNDRYQSNPTAPAMEDPESGIADDELMDEEFPASPLDAQ